MARKKPDAGFWNDLADRFSQAGNRITLRSAWRDDGTFDPLGTARFFEPPDKWKEPFLHLARVGAVALGETDGSSVCQRWFVRLAAESRDLPNSAPPGARDIVHSPDLLSERYCRQLAREAEMAPRRANANTHPEIARRAEFLRGKIAEKADGSVHRFATLSEIEHRTLDKILRCKPVRGVVISRLARFLECSERDIPSPPPE
jgi:hypothetical protein